MFAYAAHAAHPDHAAHHEQFADVILLLRDNLNWFSLSRAHSDTCCYTDRFDRPPVILIFSRFVLI